MELIIYSFLCYGASNIIMYGSIFGWLRKSAAYLGTGDYSIYKLLTCMMCLPTWVGFFFSYVLISLDLSDYLPINDSTGNIYLIVFLNGVIASGTVYLINTVVEYFEAKSITNNGDEDENSGPHLMHD